MTRGDEIVYRYADLQTLTLPANSCDLVYSSLALHYLPDIAPLFAPLQQALVPGGTLVFSAEHPIYTAPLQQGWRVDEQGQKSWPVSHYQQEGERVSNWFAEGVIKQHRKLSSWINALIAAGFVLEQLDEWGPSAEQIVQQPALDEEKERPMIFYCARVNRANPRRRLAGRASFRLSGWRRGWQSPLYTSQSSSSYCAPGCRYRHHGGRHR